jgi:hypothetical protein
VLVYEHFSLVWTSAALIVAISGVAGWLLFGKQLGLAAIDFDWAIFFVMLFSGGIASLVRYLYRR